MSQYMFFFFVDLEFIFVEHKSCHFIHLFCSFSCIFCVFWLISSFLVSFVLCVFFLSLSIFFSTFILSCIYRYSYPLLLPQMRYYPIKAAQCQVRLRQTSLNSHSVSQNPAPPRQTTTTCSSQKKCHHMPKNSSFQKGRATGQCVRFINQTAGLCGARETPATTPPPTPSLAFHPRKKRRMEEMWRKGRTTSFRKSSAGTDTAEASPIPLEPCLLMRKRRRKSRKKVPSSDAVLSLALLSRSLCSNPSVKCLSSLLCIQTRWLVFLLHTLKGIVYLKHENSVTIYSPACSSKSV